jgi:hypothetical protein
MNEIIISASAVVTLAITATILLAAGTGAFVGLYLTAFYSAQAVIHFGQILFTKTPE